MSFECSYDTNARKRIAFLDLLLTEHKQDPDRFTLADVREETDIFMFAGHDTTTSSLLMTCHAISQNPEIQKKLHEEIDSLIGIVTAFL
jgi:cytochrome P450